MSLVAFSVLGIPAPQGSKTKWGTEANPATRPWRDAVTWNARQAMLSAGAPPLEGPVRVYAVFSFPRPKSHLNSAGDVKPSAPFHKHSKPDIDKLLRALLDGIGDSGLWRDDAQVAYVSATKQYVAAGLPAGVSVEVRTFRPALVEAFAVSFPGRPIEQEAA